MNYDPRGRPIPSMYAPQRTAGMDVFGEQGQPFPTSPEQGPFIGRSNTVQRGGRCTVFSANVIDREAKSLTVTLTRIDKKAALEQADSPTLQVPLIAHVRIGAGAETASFSCDWLNGMVIALPVGSFSIDCEYPNLDTVAHPQSSVDQTVGVMVAVGQPGGGRGIRPHARYSQRMSLDAAGGGGAVSFQELPARAASVQLVTTEPDDYGSYAVEFAASASRTTRVGSRVWSKVYPAGDGELVIPNGARSVYVTNFAATAAEVTLIYGLSL